MSTYKVLETFELEGVTYEAGSEVELTELTASELVGKVELVVELNVEVPAEETPTSNDTPAEGGLTAEDIPMA